MSTHSMIETLAMTLNAETLTRVFGRAHPVLVHFPIALLITAMSVELWRIARRADRPSGTALTCCGLGVLGAIAAGVSGWINAGAESHSARLADTMEWHRWISILAAAIAAVAWALGLVGRRPERTRTRRWWVFLLVLGAGGIGFTGHLGGTMVWGDDYLLKPIFGSRPATATASEPGSAPSPSEAAFAPARRLAPAGTVLKVDYSREVLPILRSKCYECHDQNKQKADLRLDDLSALFTDDESLWSIQPGKPEDSELVYRIKLGTDAEDRMPPDGSPLSPAEIGVISRWIAEGAWEGVEGNAPEATPPPGPKSQTRTPITDWTPQQRSAIAALRSLAARVEPLSLDDPGLDINLAIAGAAVSDDALAQVGQLGQHVRSLNISGTAISDDGLAAALRTLTGLERLDASRTVAGDRAAAVLKSLNSVVLVNFFESALTDAGAASLAESSSIKHVYVSGTGLSDAGVTTLRARIAGVDWAPPPGK